MECVLSVCMSRLPSLKNHYQQFEKELLLHVDCWLSLVKFLILFKTNIPTNYLKHVCLLIQLAIFPTDEYLPNTSRL